MLLIYIHRYAAEWYKFSPRLKSLLIITLYRSNVPCGLKAGNMIPLSIATYAAVSNIRKAVQLFIKLYYVYIHKTTQTSFVFHLR